MTNRNEIARDLVAALRMTIEGTIRRLESECDELGAPAYAQGTQAWLATQVATGELIADTIISLLSDYDFICDMSPAVQALIDRHLGKA
jgi:hypothetical protein